MSHAGLGWALLQELVSSLKERERGHRTESHVTVKGEIRIVHPKPQSPKDCLEPPEAEGAKMNPPVWSFKENTALLTP